MVKAIWSEIAKKTYWDNIDYLLNNWTEKEASKFIDLVDECIDIIKENPKTFAKVDYKKTRSVVVNPQITMFYNILNKNNIEIVLFWNNAKNPDNLDL